MPLSVGGTSVERVKPDAIDNLHEWAIRRLASLKTLLASGETPDRERFQPIVNEFFDFLPEEFAAEIQNTEALKERMIDAFMRLQASRENSKKPITDQDLQLLVGRLVHIVFEHQVHGLLANRNLSKDQPQPDFDPLIHDRYSAVQVQKALEILVWFASAFTSWLGLTHYLGQGLTGLERILAMEMGADAKIVLRHALAVIGAAAASQVVQHFKRGVDHFAQVKNMTLGNAVVEQIRSVWKNSRLQLIAAVGVIIFDQATNLSGELTFLVQGGSASAQITDVRTEVGERTKVIKDQIAVAEAVPVQLKEAVIDILQKENDGDSETGLAGEGTVYQAKDLLYNEDPEADKSLDKTPLGRKLETEIRGSGLVDGKSLEKEVDSKIDPHVARINGVLEAIESKLAALDPSKEVEILQMDVDAIVADVGEAISMINDDLDDDLKAHLAKYDALNERLGAILKSSGSYPNLKLDKMQQWAVRDLDIDNRSIEVQKIEYVGLENVIQVLQARFKPGEAVVVVMIATILAFLASYLDSVVMKESRRKAYQADLAKSEEIDQKYYQFFERKLEDLLFVSLNRGPFSRYFKEGGVGVERESIREAVREYLWEESRLTQDGRAFQAISFVIPVPAGQDVKGYTSIAQRHNARMGALQKLISNPAIIGGIICRLLPKNCNLEAPLSGETWEAVREQNTANLRAVEYAEEKRVLEGWVEALEDTEKRARNPELTLAEWRTFKRDVDALERYLAKTGRTINPDNPNVEAFMRFQLEYRKLERAYPALFAGVVERYATGFVIPEKRKEDPGFLEAEYEFFTGPKGLLLEVGAGAGDEANDAAIEKAKNALERVIREISENLARIRTRKVEEERLKAIQKMDSQDNRNLRAAKEWYEARLRIGSNPIARMTHLAESLGEKYLIQSLRDESRMGTEDANRLALMYGSWLSSLSHKITEMEPTQEIPDGVLDDPDTPQIDEEEDDLILFTDDELTRPEDELSKLKKLKEFLGEDFQLIADNYFSQDTIT